MEGFSVGIPKGGGGDLEAELPRWGRRDFVTVRRTELLAEILAEAMKGSLAFRNRGLKQAHYAVLEGATMPSALVECGFLTNRREAIALEDPATHEAIAQALALGLGDYRAALARGGAEAP
jgi:N-acetylmuramoyl-L-alanine amidase